MDKSLTIEELKSLKEGDWVWLIYKDTDYHRYAQIQAIEGTRLYVWGRGLAECELWKYSDYGKRWIAYKNKEEMENAGYGNVKQAVKEFAEKLINQFNFSQDDFGFFVEVYNPAEIRLKINNLITELYGEVKK